MSKLVFELLLKDGATPGVFRNTCIRIYDDKSFNLMLAAIRQKLFGLRSKKQYYLRLVSSETEIDLFLTGLVEAGNRFDSYLYRRTREFLAHFSDGTIAPLFVREDRQWKMDIALLHLYL